MKHQAIRALGLLLCGALFGCEMGAEGTPIVWREPPEAAAPLAMPEPEAAPLAETPRAAASPRVARGSLRFVEGFQRGYEQATAEAKPMLLFFTAEWCHFCHQMADEA